VLLAPAVGGDRHSRGTLAREGGIELRVDAKLDALHQRWVLSLKSMKEDEWKKCFVHPAMGKVSLDKYLAVYGWHCRHHIAHITELRKRMKW
jgi:hypothetical protein